MSWFKNKKTALALLFSVAIIVTLATPFSISLAQQCGPDEIFDPSIVKCVPKDEYGKSPDPSKNKDDDSPGAVKPPSFWDIIRSPELLVALFVYLILEILGAILGVVAALLNGTISVTIVNMAKMFGPDGLGGSIQDAWSIIRDIFNLVFIFLLLFVGINTILGSISESRFTTKLIPKILLAALFINFSLFFSKFFIDVSNIVTLEFYNASKRYDRVVEIGNIKEEQGLAGAIMAGLRINNVYNARMEPKKDEQTDHLRHILPGMIFACLFVIVAIFVLSVITFMLIARFVSFILLLITSPIMLMGQLIPQLKTLSDKWWSTMTGNLLFAPIFFAMLLVVLEVINSDSFWNLLEKDGKGGIIDGIVQYIHDGNILFLRFFIVTSLLISALTTAKKISADAGKGVADFGSKLAGAATFGVGAMIGRRTIGQEGYKLAENKKLKFNAVHGTGVTKLMSKGLIRSGEFLQKSSFDIRGTKLGGSLDAGEAKKGGFKQIVEKSAKRQKEYEDVSTKYRAEEEEREKRRQQIEELRSNIEEVQKSTLDNVFYYNDQGSGEELDKAEALRRYEDRLNTLLKDTGELERERANAVSTLSNQQIDHVKKVEAAIKNIENDKEKSSQEKENEIAYQLERLRREFPRVVTNNMVAYLGSSRELRRREGSIKDMSASLLSARADELAVSSNISHQIAAKEIRKGDTTNLKSIARQLQRAAGLPEHSEPVDNKSGGSGSGGSGSGGGSKTI
jgi:hypothetical protein